MNGLRVIVAASFEWFFVMSDAYSQSRNEMNCEYETPNRIYVYMINKLI